MHVACEDGFECRGPDGLRSLRSTLIIAFPAPRPQGLHTQSLEAWHLALTLLPPSNRPRVQASLAMGGGSGANLAGQGPGGVPLSSIQGAHEELPFELRALEIALDTVGGSVGAGREARRRGAGGVRMTCCGMSVLSGWLLLPRHAQVLQHLERLQGDVMFPLSPLDTARR